VLKWAGGKARSLPHILDAMPERIDTYYEPFVGGAAVFFALAAEGRFKRAVLSDRNSDLIEVYRQIKRNVEAVIEELGRFTYSRDEYYRVRALAPKKLKAHERAARIIFLNKTGYNGLYRVNSKGQFNVPFGRYHRAPKFCDPDNLRAAAHALESADVQVRDFETACRAAKSGDVVYFDPPYDPVSKTANFTAYHKKEFGPTQHERLARVVKKLAARNVAIVLSNSDTKLTRELYRSFNPRKIPVSRPINSKASARGAVYELLVTNRQTE
jgi:DNA adenine methylase